MTVKAFYCFVSLLVLQSCKSGQAGNKEEAVKQIAQAEKDFAQMAKDKGIAEAFTFYADSNATIRRHNDTLITGRQGIHDFYEAPFFRSATVTWTAEHVEAAEQGDLGYTFGHYTWTATDSSGKKEESKGVFHTVWKKQKDGTWKYIWD
jgi:ketosteroid isomerase-like protein